MNFFRSLCLLFWIGGASIAAAQDDTPWKLKGYVDTYATVRTSEPYDFMMLRSRLRSQISRSWGESSLLFSSNATFNGLNPKQSQFAIREAYINHHAEHWGFRIGRQFVIWGVADGVPITDALSPMDLTEFLAKDYSDIRMPLMAMRFNYHNDWMRIEWLVSPMTQGYRIPLDAQSPWSLRPTMPSIPLLKVDLLEEKRPQINLENLEWAARWSANLHAVDFSLVGIYAWNKLPLFELQRKGTMHYAIAPQYYRMGVLGGDFSLPISSFVLRGEAAYNIDKSFQYTIDPSKPQLVADILLGKNKKQFNSLHWLLGVDWFAPRNWLLSVQLSEEEIFDYKEYLFQPQHNWLATVRLSKKALEDALEAAVFAYYDISEKMLFSRFSLDYALDDNIVLMAGYDLLALDEERSHMLSSLANNSQAWVKVRYNF